MKKVLALSMAVLAILVSCMKEQDNSSFLTKKTVIRASVADAKTALGAKQGDVYPNYWKTDDQISVNGVKSEKLDSQYDGKSSAEFVLDGVEAPYYSAYPASAVSDYSEGTANLAIPAAQTLLSGTYDPDAFLLLGSSQTADVVLNPAVALVHLTLTGTGSIYAVKISGGDSDVLSGVFSSDFTELGDTVSSANYVELKASDAIELPAEVFAAVKPGNFSKLTVRVMGADGSSMTRKANVNAEIQAGTIYKAPELAYSGSVVINPVVSDITSSTAVISWDNAPTAEYTVAIYTDQACSNLFASYTIPAGDNCWAGKSPRFCVSGMAPSTQYWAKVINTAAAIGSEAVGFTTEAFTVVEVADSPAAVGDVILAEDFSELCWDCDMIGSGSGWYPTETARTTSFTTLDVDSYQKASTSNEKTLCTQTEALNASRLSDWAQGANKNLYIHPGYIKLVGNSKVTHIVTPALNSIPEGKVATLEVTVTACAYYSESSSSFCTDKAVVAVQTGEINSLIDESTNTLDLKTNVANITLAKETAWNAYTVTVSGVVNGNRLAFGAANGVTKNDARMNLSDIKVKIKSLTDYTPGDRNITDFTSLKNFCDDVNGGKVALNGFIKNDITLSSEEAEQITGIDSFYASLDGEEHTITGLTCPLVDKLYGEICNLTLNSTIAEAGQNVGIFARKVLADDTNQGNITSCNAQGSLTFSASADDELSYYVGGIAGQVSGGVISTSTSGATVTAGGTNSVGNLYLGGIVGYCDGILGDVTNDGAVVSEELAISNLHCQGGIAGKMSPSADDVSLENITNNGAVTVNAASCKNGYWGGVFGDNTCLSNIAITNNAALSIGAIVPSSYFFVGGVSGNASGFGAVYENAVCSNSASITLDGATISTSTGFALGGLFGKITNFETITSSGNSAPIVINSLTQTTKGRIDVGGIVGYIQTGSGNTHKDGVLRFSNSYNAGSISFTGSEPNRVATYIRLGGLIGNALSEREEGDETLSLDGCYNSGTITMPMAATNAGIMIGGLVGNDRFAHYVQTGSYNTGDIELSGANMGTKDDGLYGLHIGGNVGFIYHEGTASSATITGDDQHATNSGMVNFNVTATWCAYRPAVGGIVGVAAGKGSEKPLTINLTDCTNSGDLMMAMENMPSKSNMGQVYSYSYAGGILGIAGIPFSNQTTKEDDTTVYDQSYVVSNITNCSNNATIKWGKINSSMSGSYNYYWSTYAGGIIGVSRPVPGTEYMTTITSCTNSGNILSYDGCAGGIAGAMLYSGTITGAADAYTVNTGKVMRDGCSKPQGQAGGIMGWVRIDSANPAGLNFNYCCNTGYIYANAGVGGFWGYVSYFDKYEGSIHHLKLAGTVRSSTTTGNSGMFSGNASGNIKGNSGRISNVAIGGTLNGKNSAETTINFTADDFVSQARAGFMEYKTTANNLTEEQVTSMKLQYWDGTSEPEWL